MAKLIGKTALITGASRGLGRGIALALAREGAATAVAARSAGELEELARTIKDLGAKSIPFVADVSRADEVRSVVSGTIAELGGIDILVNNAGVGKYSPLTEQSVEDYDWMMNTNMRSTFLFSHAVLPHMQQRRSGQIITISSVAGLKGMPNEAIYCATKFAQVGFMQALDYEARPFGIKVTTICPGGIDTHFAIGTGRTSGDPVLREFLDAETVADAVVFAATQPEKSRIIEMVMRPMREPQ